MEKIEIIERDKQSRDFYQFYLTLGSIYKKHEVLITFENDKFKECKFDFSAPFTREQWKALAMINEKITEIEKKRYKKESKDS